MDLSKGSLDAAMPVQSIVRKASVPHNAPDALARLAAALHPEDLELVALFISPDADVEALVAQCVGHFGDAKVIGCTTAGEIGETGYTEGCIVAVGLPRAHFRARTVRVDNLCHFDGQDLINRMILARNELIREMPDWDYEFTFMVIDGLSTKEDQLTSELAVGLGPVPLFGGSAGDGTTFGTTRVIHDGAVHSNAAVLSLIRTDCPIKVFKTDHLVPTEQRMVVTGADPVTRTVHEINAEPAAREYARMLGKDPEQLTTFTFAAHPVVVRIGGQHHVRSIQRVADNGDLIFFSAIDEGLVLTLAEPQNMVTHLQQEMDKLCENGAPDTIIACDCFLRRMEAQQKQMSGAISDILAQNRVVGFSTYGEQLNSMHVNQTLTGVAIYPPKVR